MRLGSILEMHEQLLFSAQPDRDDMILPGAVFTLEPELYYANKGYGVRLEAVSRARLVNVFFYEP